MQRFFMGYPFFQPTLKIKGPFELGLYQYPITLFNNVEKLSGTFVIRSCKSLWALNHIQ